MRRIKGTITKQTLRNVKGEAHWVVMMGEGVRYSIDLEISDVEDSQDILGYILGGAPQAPGGIKPPGDILGALQEELEKKTGKDLGGEDA